MKKLFKRLKKELRVYFRSWEMLMRGSMEYRGWPLKLLQTFLFVTTDPLDLILLFSRFGSIGEWSMEQIVLVYAMSVCCFGLAECFGRGFDLFPDLVRSGGLDRVLLRPCSIFSQVASSSFQFHRLVRPTTCAVAIVWCLARMGVRMGLREILILTGAMLGGMTSGYWATGSRNREAMPRITRKSEMTAAKRGRSMKKRDIGFRASTAARRGSFICTHPRGGRGQGPARP